MNDIELFTHTAPPVGLDITPTEEALAARDGLIADALSITAVKTDEENARCANIGVNIQMQIKRTEKIGLKLRQPYNAEADKIKAVQDDYLDPLRPHLKRLGSLSASYRADQEREAEAERRARAEEISRLQEQTRQAAAAARLAAEKGDQMAELVADIGRQALADLTTAAIAQPEPEAVKVAGQSFRPRQVDFRCIDPIALWNARPELCNPPTPKASAIKAVCTPDHPVAGLELFYVDKVNFKSR